MNKQTQDRRKSSVREAIQQAYLDSLQSPGKITAAQLCKKAHVNRSSFYNHFADISDVRETLENELFESVAGEPEEEIAGRISRLNGAVLTHVLQSGTKTGHTL